MPPPLALGPLAAAVFAANLGLTVIFPLIPRLAAEAGPALVGWIFASYAACLVVSQIVTGILADRLGAARVLVAALALYGLVLLAFTSVRGLAGIMAIRALEGLAVGAIIPAVMAIVAVGVPVAVRGRAMGKLMGLGGIGFIVGPVMGERLSRFGLAWPFLAAAAIAGVALLATLIAAKRGTLGPTTGEDKPSLELGQEWAALRSRLATPFFWGLVIPLIAIKANFGTLQGGLPLVGEQVLHVDPATVSGLFVLTAVAYGLATPLTGRLSDRYPSRTLAFGCLAILAILALALAPLNSPWPFFVVFAFFATAQSAGYMLATKHLADGLGTAAIGRGLGLASAIGDVGMIVGPLALLPLFAWHPAALFVGMAATALAAIATSAALASRASRSESL